MAKKQLTTRIEEDMLDYAEYLSNELGISKSSIPEFALRLLNAYYTTQQLKMEAVVYSPRDARRKE